MREPGIVQPVFQAPKLEVKVPTPKNRLGAWGYGFAFLASVAFSLALLVTLNLHYGFIALGVHASITLAVVNLAICAVLSAGLLINAMVVGVDAIEEVLDQKSKSLSFWFVLSALALCISAVSSVVGFDLFLQLANLLPALGLLAAVGIGIILIRFAILPALYRFASRQLVVAHPAVTGFINSLNHVCDKYSVAPTHFAIMQSQLDGVLRSIDLHKGMVQEECAFQVRQQLLAVLLSIYVNDVAKQVELGVKANSNDPESRRIWHLLKTHADWSMPANSQQAQLPPVEPSVVNTAPAPQTLGNLDERMAQVWGMFKDEQSKQFSCLEMETAVLEKYELSAFQKTSALQGSDGYPDERLCQAIKLNLWFDLSNELRDNPDAQAWLKCEYVDYACPGIPALRDKLPQDQAAVLVAMLNKIAELRDRYLERRTCTP